MQIAFTSTVDAGDVFVLPVAKGSKDFDQAGGADMVSLALAAAEAKKGK